MGTGDFEMFLSVGFNLVEILIKVYITQDNDCYTVLE